MFHIKSAIVCHRRVECCQCCHRSKRLYCDKGLYWNNTVSHSCPNIIIRLQRRVFEVSVDFHSQLMTICGLPFPKSATLLSVPTTIIDTNEGAPSYNIRSCYGATSHDSTLSGVWYQIVGDGEPVEASMCGSGPEGDSVMSVWTGECHSLECVTSNDNYCGSFSRVVFNTNVGQTYYIFICKFSFNLRLVCKDRLLIDTSLQTVHTGLLFPLS